MDSLQYKDIKIQNRLDAWLAFLGSDDPEIIIDIIEQYPDFKKMYQQVYDICRNIEEVMGMFSKELLEMDRNTVELMIDEMQDEIKQQKRLYSIEGNVPDPSLHPAGCRFHGTGA